MLHKFGLALCAILVLTVTAWFSAVTGTSWHFAYSLLALTAFGLELADGSTMAFVFIILALPRLGWSETLLMATSALFIQAVVRKDRPAPKALLQSLMATVVAILVSQGTFHFQSLARVDVPVRLMLASGMCFVALRALGPKKADLWSFAFYPFAAGIAALVPVSAVLPVFVYLTWRSYRVYERRIEQERKQSREAASLHLRTIETLASAIEAKDQLSAGQSRRVQIYAVELAKELGLPALEIEALRAASMLYDIGEMAVPENIIFKAGPLTPDEFEKVKIHPTVGAELLERVKFPYPVAPIVRAHHERWDGAGYPHGLKGDQIPIGARILSAVDAFHSMTSDRPYRPALTLEDALKHMSSESGKAFDPRVVTLLRKRYAQWENLVAEQPNRDFMNSIFSAQREAQVVFDLVQKLGSSLDLNETFAALKPALRSLVRFETMVLWVERDGQLVAECVEGAHVTLCSSLRLPLGGGVSGWVAANGKPIVNGDAAFEMAQPGIDPETCPFNYALAVPLEEAGVRGALTIYRIGERRFSAEDARMLSAVAPKLSTVMANGLKFRRTAHQASTDALTGLPNAGALFGRLSSGVPTALLVCDLDGFKPVNDRFGHLTGNRVLQAIADGFRRSCRGNDFVARVGGDEFVVLIDNLRPEEVGGRIDQFREMVRAMGRQVCGEDVLDASFGAAFHPVDGKTPEELIKVADAQMYRRKEEQKSGVLRIAVNRARQRAAS